LIQTKCIILFEYLLVKKDTVFTNVFDWAGKIMGMKWDTRILHYW